MKIETIGLDIAVQIFQAHGVDRSAGTGLISARGFSDRNHNKMLVLVDGRSAYTAELGSVH